MLELVQWDSTVDVHCNLPVWVLYPLVTLSGYTVPSGITERTSTDNLPSWP
jgi:hypothetical protein